MCTGGCDCGGVLYVGLSGSGGNGDDGGGSGGGRYHADRASSRVRIHGVSDVVTTAILCVAAYLVYWSMSTIHFVVALAMRAKAGPQKPSWFRALTSAILFCALVAPHATYVQFFVQTGRKSHSFWLPDSTTMGAVKSRVLAKENFKNGAMFDQYHLMRGTGPHLPDSYNLRDAGVERGSTLTLTVVGVGGAPEVDFRSMSPESLKKHFEGKCDEFKEMNESDDLIWMSKSNGKASTHDTANVSNMMEQIIALDDDMIRYYSLTKAYFTDNPGSPELFRGFSAMQQDRVLKALNQAVKQAFGPTYVAPDRQVCVPGYVLTAKARHKAIIKGLHRKYCGGGGSSSGASGSSDIDGSGSSGASNPDGLQAKVHELDANVTTQGANLNGIYQSLCGMNQSMHETAAQNDQNFAWLHANLDGVTKHFNAHVGELAKQVKILSDAPRHFWPNDLLKLREQIKEDLKITVLEKAKSDVEELCKAERNKMQKVIDDVQKTKGDLKVQQKEALGKLEIVFNTKLDVHSGRVRTISDRIREAMAEIRKQETLTLNQGKTLELVQRKINEQTAKYGMFQHSIDTLSQKLNTLKQEFEKFKRETQAQVETAVSTAANAEAVALAMAKTASHETQELGGKLNETREEMKSLKEDLKLIDEQADADAAETKAQLDANKEQLDKMSKQLGTRIPELQIDTHAGVKYLDGGILHLPVSNILKVAFSIDSSKVYPMMVDLITGSLPKGCEVELQTLSGFGKTVIEPMASTVLMLVLKFASPCEFTPGKGMSTFKLSFSVLNNMSPEKSPERSKKRSDTRDDMQFSLKASIIRLSLEPVLGLTFENEDTREEYVEKITGPFGSKELKAAVRKQLPQSRAAGASSSAATPRKKAAATFEPYADKAQEKAKSTPLAPREAGFETPGGNSQPTSKTSGRGKAPLSMPRS